ncbi:hypothetical protein O6H91_06G028100 [Diphasiastrum complanatum]|uniref:Uncharacterized protein n=2 Tax=Diphasiastrum complanatum TaxID=34168 RepID=A0ACC2DBS0_DIPCM|nr:hypothetical protein O6H91_06G028100 [Diphasiastrum complanatum]KAJ7551774.1 hypothetical protein O6H91_06G028100 [Diphasiastrum complanatum]
MAKGRRLFTLMTALVSSLCFALPTSSSSSFISSPAFFTSTTLRAEAAAAAPRSPRIGATKILATSSSPFSDSAKSHDDDVGIKCAADVLAVLGGKEAAASLNASRAHQLLSDMRFLAPLQGSSLPTQHLIQSITEIHESGSKASLKSGGMELLKQGNHNNMQRLIRSPPSAVAELAKVAVEWAGEPEAVLAKLSPTIYPVPDVEGTAADQCQLAKNTSARRFAAEEINKYMAFLFEAIHVLGPSAGFNVSLSRYDLFHGHMFTAYNTGRLGILFHSREYPEFDKTNFPINLGYCQRGSDVPYDASMNLRNILWLAPMPACNGHQCSNKWLAPGALVILDAHPGGVYYKELVPEWVDVVRTIYEGDFGQVFIDVNYFNVANAAPEARIFLC